MQAIHTKFLPCTNTRGARIKASCERGDITIDYPYELWGDQCHRKAAQALIDKFVAEDGRPDWQKPFVTGCLPSGGYAHVFVD